MEGYAAAMAAGLLKLQGMMEDLEVGPREEEPEASKARKARSLFGFGFGLPSMGQK